MNEKAARPPACAGWCCEAPECPEQTRAWVPREGDTRWVLPARATHGCRGVSPGVITILHPEICSPNSRRGEGSAG